MRLKEVFLSGAAGLALSVAGAFAQTPRPAQIPVPQVQQSGKMSFLGVGLQEITPDRARELRLPEEAGVEITSIQPESPASAAGLRVGDVIVNYHGQPVEGTEQFTRLVQETPPGREVKLQIYRGGNPQTVTAKIGSHSAPQVSRSQAPFVLPLEPPRLQQGLRPATPSGGGGELGIQAIQVEGQLADYFGTKQGVLVASVVSGSPAEKAGLKAGDVITRAGDARIATPADVSNQIRMARGKSLSLTIVRDHREMTLNAPLDERF